MRHAWSTRIQIIVTYTLLSVALLAPSAPALPASDAELLDQVIAGAHRTPAFKLRDQYRHPKETLLFFGLRPDMHVVEISPGAGWYLEILAPYLRERGRYYAADYPDSDATLPQYRERRRALIAKMEKEPALYGRTIVTSLLPPHEVTPAPGGSADLVLTFRNVHNWTERGHDQKMFDIFFTILKPGGVLGVVEHRAKDSASLEEMKRSGYMTEQIGRAHV